jgi:uncharacterized membrane protein
MNFRFSRKQILIFFSLFALTLLFARIFLTGKLTFIFLIWNLFLGWIPLVLAQYLTQHHQKISSLKRYGIAAMWLLFFPNAPYMLTDFVHLKNPMIMPWWYDLLLVSAFAMSSMALGLWSLRLMQKIIASRFNENIALLFVACCAFLASFGVYLGRFLRWNSWDLFTQPIALFKSIGYTLCNNHHAWGLTLLLGIFLLLMHGLWAPAEKE